MYSAINQAARATKGRRMAMQTAIDEKGLRDLELKARASSYFFSDKSSSTPRQDLRDNSRGRAWSRNFDVHSGRASKRPRTALVLQANLPSSLARRIGSLGL
jgi:hypothetical protein